jgi:hypothetical protein
MDIYCFLVETWNHERLRVTRFFERACLVRRPPFVRSALAFTLAAFATALVEDGITLLGALEGALETGGGGGKVDGGGGLTAASAVTVTIFVSFVDLFLTVTS